MDETTTTFDRADMRAALTNERIGLGGYIAELLRALADLKQEQLAGWAPDMADPEELRLHAKRLEFPAKLRSLAECLGGEDAFVLRALEQAVRDSQRAQGWRP